MRKTRTALAVAVAGLAALAWAAFTSPVESQQGARPIYTADGKMLQLPAGFETWVLRRFEPRPRVQRRDDAERRT